MFLNTMVIYKGGIPPPPDILPGAVCESHCPIDGAKCRSRHMSIWGEYDQDYHSYHWHWTRSKAMRANHGWPHMWGQDIGADVQQRNLPADKIFKDLTVP